MVVTTAVLLQGGVVVSSVLLLLLLLAEVVSVGIDGVGEADDVVAESRRTTQSCPIVMVKAILKKVTSSRHVILLDLRRYCCPYEANRIWRPVDDITYSYNSMQRPFWP
jgi:hypothetical protein